MSRLKPVSVAVLLTSLGTMSVFAPLYADSTRKQVPITPKKNITVQKEAALSSSAVPLFAAKAALSESMMAWQAGYRDLMKTNLQKAIGFFKVAGQSPDVKMRAAAAELLPEAQQILSELHNDNIVSKRFYRLLERTQAYSERAAEYLRTGWKPYRSKGFPLRSDLIEARFHLLNARFDLFTAHEANLAQQELNIANEFLNHAVRVSGRSTANSNYKQQLNKLQTIIKALGHAPSSSEQAWYSALQQQLDEMIKTL